jgi:hypothetical protein
VFELEIRLCVLMANLSAVGCVVVVESRGKLRWEALLEAMSQSLVNISKDLTAAAL